MVLGSREGLIVRTESSRKSGMRRMISGMGKKLPFLEEMGPFDGLVDRIHPRANSAT